MLSWKAIIFSFCKNACHWCFFRESFQLQFLRKMWTTSQLLKELWWFCHSNAPKNKIFFFFLFLQFLVSMMENEAKEEYMFPFASYPGFIVHSASLLWWWFNCFSTLSNSFVQDWSICTIMSHLMHITMSNLEMSLLPIEKGNPL